MSIVLRSYDWSVVSRTNKRARSRNYPWDEWFDGRIHRLEPGEDFDGPPTSLERVIRTSANRRGIKVRIRIDEGAVVVQRHEDGEVMRTVTKSPSLRSIIAAREAAASPRATAASAKTKTNGHRPAKTAVKKAPATKVMKRAAKV